MSGEKEVKRSCCTWPKVLALVLFCVVIGVIIWQFAPIDKGLDKIVPQFNSTNENSVGDGGNTNSDKNNSGGNTTSGGGDSGNNTSGGDQNGGNNSDSSTETYQFKQCSQNAIDAGNCCNGLETICDLGVDEILYAATHNANAAYDNGFLISPNQKKIFQQSLVAGYRGINMDLCPCNGKYQFCHSLCDVGSLAIDTTLADMDQFLDENPTEVLLFNIQLNDNADINVFDSILRQVNGGAFADKLYVHSDPEASWPTLRQVIAAGTRVLLFHYEGTDCSAGNCPKGLHYWFQYASETQFSFTSIDSVENVAYSCNITRGSSSQSKTFFGVNNFVTPPIAATSRELNAYDFVKSRIADCSAQNSNLDVNIMFVDFWDEGDLPKVTQEHNQALAARRRKLGKSSFRKH